MDKQQLTYRSNLYHGMADYHGAFRDYWADMNPESDAPRDPRVTRVLRAAAAAVSQVLAAQLAYLGGREPIAAVQIELAHIRAYQELLRYQLARI